jgi:hypothetical protein
LITACDGDGGVSDATTTSENITLRPENAIAVDANARSADLDAQASYGLDEQFTAALIVTASRTSFAAYNLELAWDPDALALDSFEFAEGDLCDDAVAERGRLSAKCVAAGESSGAARLVTLALRCTALGQAVLHLQRAGEVETGTQLTEPSGSPIEAVTLIDAAIACG